MILKSLTLSDFGVFSGQHVVDLAPRVKYGHKRPIVLFGGLNGAGKTTTLTAVRLALYGRRSMGRSISTQAYHQQLIEYIHKPRKSVVAPNASSIELDFTFGKQGTVNDFKIVRSWEHTGTKTTEHLEIHKDGQVLEGLSSEQLQSFLNELIPIGVADLFFFDGEKIADLAEDEGNEALADAIKRLLGLDIIDRLRADLGVYLRENTQTKHPKDIAQELKAFEKQYQKSYAEYQSYLSQSEELNTELVAVTADVATTQQRLNDLGGAWAKSREAEEIRSEQLIKEKTSVNDEIKALFSDAIPLALAKKSIESLLKQLEAEKAAKNRLATQKELNKHMGKLRAELTKAVGKSNQKAIDEAIASTLEPLNSDNNSVDIIHDISDSELSRIQTLVTSYVPQQVQQLKKLSSRAERLEEELANAAANIARAPEQSRLDDILAELGELQGKRGGLVKQIEVNKEEAKRSLRAAMDNLRRLRDLDEKFSKSMSHGQGIELAANSRAMLSEFSEQTRVRKLAILEQEFVKSFGKLARKEDMDIQAKIDPTTFDVNLSDRHGKAINKKKLSAGEKQIYAIAMLEALGRTSGRSLPIIIDTPLGRLDSKHRTKLVKNYFPTASHQVLILSTDTEIDEDFYSELSPEISHAFSVDYDSKAGCSEFNEGYFWRSKL
ncbi:DNA sulfur modification protein DndD [Halieaceae bacterium IMCC14734]|uniref:DNA sulfur modification protein DndD n=1 Tax=Candidatus Litorirhabdus singularis TaxID=2518993 RepID=A0ABT3TMD2_9GAMM|nr:DNA sulfur modification protein DndD [Candidatus Litorirhabdus singularis]MCX2982876.1 DNA sulfur modification protein DndD [Candidatus Litorirhabdus singularis]